MVGVAAAYYRWPLFEYIPHLADVQKRYGQFAVLLEVELALKLRDAEEIKRSKGQQP